VFVTPESAVGEMFRLWMVRKKVAQQLDWIYIDECHVMLNNWTDFWRKLQEMGQLNSVRVQMVLLMATLLPSCKGELWRRMGWKKLQVWMFWAFMSWIKIGYGTIWIEGQGKVISQYAAVVEKAFTKYPVGKAVVYCNTVNMTKDLAQVLNCWAFYHDAEEKMQILQWFCIEGWMMVAMSVFSMGIDIADIWLIIHIGWLRTLLDYAQESGCAGWDGLESEVVVVIWWSQFMEAGQEPKDQLVQLFVEGAECKCWILDEYLDGWRVWIGCEEEEVECKVCWDGRQVGMQEMRVMEHEEEEKQEEVSSEEEMEGEVEERQQEELSSEEERDEVEERQQEELSSEEERDEDVEELKAAQLEWQVMADECMTATKEVAEEAEGLWRYLENICGTCSFCWWRLGEKREHVLFWCWELKGFNAQNWFKVLQGMIWKMWCMAQYSECMECFVLMEWCNQFEERGLGS